MTIELLIISFYSVSYKQYASCIQQKHLIAFAHLVCEWQEVVFFIYHQVRFPLCYFLYGSYFLIHK
ncbi:hypothetical protein CW304_11055 [Bacillus sp. UFRGS-B20]|nr:hypothetical protein CW304_11055 [Bacillus sp. UFRGS-B20]